MNVAEILRHKGSDIAWAVPGTTVREAVAQLAEHGVGALVVSTDGVHLAGILSERDVIRGLSQDGPDVLDRPLTDIMTTEVQTCCPADRVEHLMARMTTGRFRHMPVLDEDRLAGIISIGDVVKQRVSELENDATLLLDYIRGR